MTAFNPSVGGSNDPNYFNYSHPISGIEADKSTGIALSTIGQGIEGATALADQTIKDVIKKDVYAKVDTERDAFTSALNTTRDAQRGSVVPAPVQTGSGATADLSLTSGAPTGSAPVPAAIDVGLNKIDAVQSALAAGKINDTYYTQRLNSVAKDLRTQYPGYREFIDQRISEATGINPANSYVKNLMEDINRQAGVKDTEKNKTETMLRKSVEDGVPNSDVVLRMFRNGQISQDAAETYVYRNNADMYKIKQQDAQRANMKGSREEISTQRTADFTNEIGKTVDNNFHTIQMAAGGDTPAGILDFINKVNNGQASITGQQSEALATKLASQKALLQTQLKSRANQMTNGVSYASDIGADKTDGIIKSQLSVYDAVIDAIKNKDYGTAFTHMNMARAINDDTKANVLNNKDVGRFVALSKVFQDQMGPNWTNLVTMEGLRKDMDQKFRGLYTESSLEARAQPDFASTGVPKTINDHFAEGKQKGVKDPKYYSSLIDIVNDIRNPDAPDADKANVIKYLYDPKNSSFLSNFKTDYTDPNTGKVVPGKYSAFTRMTSPDITDQIAKISKSDPKAGDMYKQWVETSFGHELFGEEIKNLNKFTGHDDLHFAYDSDSHRFTLLDKFGKPPVVAPIQTLPGGITTAGVVPPRPDSGYLFQVERIINRLNSGMQSLAHVEDSFGGDTNAYLLNVLQHSQLDFNGNISGLPKSLADAIANSRKSTAKRMEDTFGNLGGNKK